MHAENILKNEVYVFDSALPGFQELVSAIPANQRIIILDASSDGVQQLMRALANEFDLDAIHIFSHGSVGSITLGTAILNQASLGGYTEALAQIGSALNDSGDLLLYGCNVAQGDAGSQFMNSLAQFTGADVAASNDPTGAAALGGDWVLEQATGPIETALPVPGEYSGLLGIPASSPAYDLATFSGLAGLSLASYIHDVPGITAAVAATGWTYSNTEWVRAPNPYAAGTIDAQAIQATRTINGKSEMAISFEGTANGTDWWTDFSPWGFSAYWEALRPTVEKWIHDGIRGGYSKFYLTGHSLGGAAAQIGMLDMVLPREIDIWEPTSVFSSTLVPIPLKVGNRFGAGFSASELAYLKDHLAGATFGAPSISIDPPSKLPTVEDFQINTAYPDLAFFKNNLLNP